MNVGALILNPVTQNDRTAAFKAPNVRAKLYEQTLASEMEETPMLKKLLSKAGKPGINTQLDWFERRYGANYIVPTDVYSDSGLSSAITTMGTASGTTVYIKLTEANAKTNVIPGQQRILTCTTLHRDLSVRVTEVVFNGASSYAKCTTLGTDTYGVLASSTLTFGAGAVACPENSKLPEGTYEEPVKHYNFYQTIMEAYSISGAELSDENLYDKDTYDDGVSQMMNRFHRSLEFMLRYGIRGETTGAGAVLSFGAAKTGKLYTAGGFRDMMTNMLTTAGERNDFLIPQTASFEGFDFTGKTWNDEGWTWFKKVMARLGKYSGKPKDMLVGADAWLSIMDLLEGQTQVTIGMTTKDAWGFEVNEIRGMNCVLRLKQDAMFSTNPAWTRRAIIWEPEMFEMSFKNGRDISVITSQSVNGLPKQKVDNGWYWVDGIKEGVYCDATLKINNIQAHAFVDGIGLDFKAS